MLTLVFCTYEPEPNGGRRTSEEIVNEWKRTQPPDPLAPTQQQIEEFHAERPYYGMDDQYIDQTDIGPHTYEEDIVTGPNGGTSYTFVNDSGGWVYVVKTDGHKVVMVQYLEGGKIKWAETETGIHTPTGG